MQKRTSSQIYQPKQSIRASGQTASIAGASQPGNSREAARKTDNGGTEIADIASLLQKISYQLDAMQQTENSGQEADLIAGAAGVQETEKQNGVNSGQQAETNGAGATGQETTEQLQAMFQQLLQNNTGTKSKQSSNENSGQTQGEQGKKQIPAQTAAQVLAQAQYELSNELEASLKKLKQVINESERIANKISTLLGEENNNQG